jgi:hypothetical protein
MLPIIKGTADPVKISRRIIENHIESAKVQAILKLAKAASAAIPAELERLVSEKMASCDEGYHLAAKYTPFLNFILPKACDLTGVKDVPRVVVECFRHVGELGVKGNEDESVALSPDAFTAGMTHGETNDVIINIACCAPWFKQVVKEHNRKSDDKQGYGVRQLVFTLCHELRHVAQNQLGMLKLIGDDGTHLWCGRKIPPSKTRQQYESLPWEIDANEKSNSVMPLLLRSL